jgi:glutathione S-transferase
MLLYDNPMSGNCYKVRLLLALLGIAYERRELSVLDRSDRAQMLQWMFFEQYSHEPNIAVLRFWAEAGIEPPAAELEAKRGAGEAALAAMDRHLNGREFLVADAYSLADIALYAYTHVAHEGGFSLERYPAVEAWLARVAARSGHVTIDD